MLMLANRSCWLSEALQSTSRGDGGDTTRTWVCVRVRVVRVRVRVRVLCGVCASWCACVRDSELRVWTVDVVREHGAQADRVREHSTADEKK